MVRRHPPPPKLPGIWLFSDERIAASMVELAALLPPGSGIVLRHDGLAKGERWRLARRLMRIARVRGLVLLLAGAPAEARRWGMDGVHLRQHRAGEAARARRLGLFVTMPVHDGREARRARRARAAAVFISPLHPTRSHPDAPALGRAAWLRLARLSATQAAALGGMTPARARQLRRASGISGWAAINHWLNKTAKRRAQA
ncbi:thiamine phosphate synthase [Sphingopyxis panaciterrae]